MLKLGIYRYYKSEDKLYKVIDIARNSEGEHEEMVMYESLYSISEFGGEGVVFVRPLKMFLENILVDGKEVPRFVFVREL